MEQITLDTHYPDPGLLEKAAAVIRGGGTCVFPTETVYGVGGNGLDPAVIARVAALKGRPEGKPMGLIVPDAGWIRRLCLDVPPPAERLAGVFWPGPLTMVLKADGCVPEALRGPGGTVALRQSSLRMCSLLAGAAACPLIATSANLAGGSEAVSLDGVAAEIKDGADLVIDGGPTGTGIPSTVVDLTDGLPRILRKGAITQQEISDVYDKE